VSDHLPELDSIHRLLSTAQGVDLEQIFATLAKSEPPGEVAPSESRAAKRRAWQVPRKLSAEETQIVVGLADVLGSAPLPESSRALAPDETKSLMDEILRVRSAQDILNGRHDAIRAGVFRAMDHMHGDATEPHLEEAEIRCDSLGKRFIRQVSGGKATPDWAALESVVPADVWEGLTRLVVVTTEKFEDGQSVGREQRGWREVREEKVIEALKTGAVTLDHLRAITRVSRRTPAFYIRDLDEQK
jgi:hypothetical protein